MSMAVERVARQPSGMSVTWRLPWLVFLLPLLFDAYYRHAHALGWALTIGGMLIAAALYWSGFSARGLRLTITILAFFFLGALFSPYYTDSSCFFTYGASFIGASRRGLPLFRALALYCCGILVLAPILHFTLPAWTVGVVLSALIGFMVSKALELRDAYRELAHARDEVELLATVAERERIARDLHDVLGHTLSVVILKSELAAKLAERDLASAASEVREIERVARGALADLRETITGFRTLGIAAEVSRAKAVLQEAGFTVETEIAPVRLGAKEEAALALALREATTNVVRHSRAKCVVLRLVSEDARCRLQIRDDGVGGDVREGNGLAGMRERVQALGGNILRNGSAGMHLSIDVPLGTSAS